MNVILLTSSKVLSYKNNVNLSLKCRYTLQYTYPYAYYMESGPRKKLVSTTAFYRYIEWSTKTLISVHPGSFLSRQRCLKVPKTSVGGFFLVFLSLCLQFEYQQAQLEAEIENLSWKVERADSYERGVVGGEGELSASDRGVSTV